MYVEANTYTHAYKDAQKCMCTHTHVHVWNYWENKKHGIISS